MFSTNTSWKFFWSTLGASLSGSFGVGMMVFGMVLGTTLAHLLTDIAVLTIIGAAFTLGANRMLHRSPMFAHVRFRTKQHFTAWIGVAATAHAALSLAWVISPRLFAVWTILTVILWALTYSTMRMHEYALNQLTPTETREERQERREVERAERQRAPEEIHFINGMTSAGYGWAYLKSWQSLVAEGERFGVSYRIGTRESALNAKGGGSVELSTKDRKRIAISMSKQFGTDLETNWIGIREERVAGDYTIDVNRLDIMAKLYPYENTIEFADIREPAPVAYGTDGQLYVHDLMRHGDCLGGTTNGKSSLINTILAYITRCATHTSDGYPRDGGAVMWILGSHKFYESYGPWIEPYKGTSEKIPFDWLAYGPQDAANMLAAALAVSDARQNRDMAERGDEVPLFVLLDEAYFILAVKDIYALYQGSPVKPDELAAMIMRATASAQVYLILSNQRGTNDNYGDWGGDINANKGWTACFRTRDPGEIGRQLDDYHLTNPTNKGQFWLQPGEGLPVDLKAIYMQESNPNKKKLHDGATDRDVAWSRRLITQELDEFSQQAAGEHYANRHTLPDAVLAYMKNQTAPTAASVANPQPGDDDIAELEAMFADYLDDEQSETPQPTTPAPAPAPTPAPEPPAPAPRKNRNIHDQVEEVINRNDDKMDKQSVMAALRADEIDATPGAVGNALTDLVNDGRVDRPARGVYASIHQHTPA